MKHSEKKPIHNLALNLRNLRGSMTQERLAELSGLTKNAISLIENEERWPRKKTLSSIAKALGTTVYELLNGPEIKNTINENVSDSIQKEVVRGFEDVKQLIKETMAELSQKSQPSDQPVDAKLELNKEEMEIITLLREKPHYASTIVKLLTPKKPIPDNSIPLVSKSVTTVAKRKAK